MSNMSGIEPGMTAASAYVKMTRVTTDVSDEVIVRLLYWQAENTFAAMSKLVDYAKNITPEGEITFREGGIIDLELRIPPAVSQKGYESALQRRDALIKEFLKIYGIEHFAKDVAPLAQK